MWNAIFRGDLPTSKKNIDLGLIQILIGILLLLLA